MVGMDAQSCFVFLRVKDLKQPNVSTFFRSFGRYATFDTKNQWQCLKLEQQAKI